MTKKRSFLILGVISIIGVMAYLFFWLLTRNRTLPLTISAFSTIMTRRSLHVIALIAAAILIALASLAFQTITHNRILTPSMLGFDSIFIATQTSLVYFFGRGLKFITNPYLNFIITTGIMMIVSFLMYSLILRKNKNNIVLLLLAGLVLTSLVGSLTTYMVSTINPIDLLVVQSLTQTTVSNINTNLVYIAVPLMIVVIGFFGIQNKTYDIIALGEDQATNLGVNYKQKTNTSLILIAIAISISTALIGPMTFLGLLAVNAAREILKTHKHKSLMFLASIIAVIFLVVGQLIVEQTKIATVVTVIIDLVGGIYMIVLMMKETQR